MNEPHIYTIILTFLLIFARMIGFFVQVPIWGSHHVQKPILAATAACISLIIYPWVPITKGLDQAGLALQGTYMFRLYGLVLAQFTVGLAIGYTSYIIMAAVQFGAELLDVQMGLSVAASFDPASHGAVNMIRRWAFYLAMILYLMMGWHIKALEAMKYSYEVIPLTGIPLSAKLISDMLLKTGYIFTLGLQIASPIVSALFITQVGLGLLARVAPQMNVFMLSFPLNILIGLTLLSSSLMLLRDRLMMLFADNQHWMILTIRLLIPHGGRLGGG